MITNTPNTSSGMLHPPIPEPETSGWGTYLDNAGMNGFSDISKNLGYVIAMLPDMLIGMFTGKTSSFTVGNNILPLGGDSGRTVQQEPTLKAHVHGIRRHESLEQCRP